MKVTVLGAAGGIGQPLSLLLKNNLPAGSELALYDISPITPGVAVDLSHIPSEVAVSGHGQDGLSEALKGADIVLIPAGVPRKPGMTRDDLFNVNAGIIKNLMQEAAKACPDACFAIITNPVNTTVAIAAEVLKKAGVYNPKKLFGVTTLDVIRSKTFVAEKKGLNPTEVEVNVIGGHSGVTILPLLSQIAGVTFSDEEARAMTDRIQNAGTEVVEAKAGGGSATLSMATAGANFADSLVRALQGESVTVCTYVACEGQKVDFFAGPVQLGKDGVDKILPLGEMNDLENEFYRALLPTLEANIKKGVEFANA